MATYKSFDQLNGKTLQRKDIVIFGDDIRYVVASSFLHSAMVANDMIFRVISKTNEPFIEALASAAYGYRPKGGCWPQSSHEDWEALTRLVLVLYAFYEGSEEVEVRIKSKWVKINRKVVVGDYEEIDRAFFKLGRYNHCEVDYTNKWIKVGCSTFTFKEVEKVYNLTKKKK